MSNTSSHHNPQNWLLLGALTLIWGSSYILIKKSLLGFSAIEVACLRLSITCLFSLPFAYKALKKIPRKKYLLVLAVGVLASGAPAFLFAVSLTKSSSAINGILNSLSPLWTLVLGYYLFRISISQQKLWGVIIGFLGAAVLVLGKRGAEFKVDVIYSLLPIAATFCYGLGSNLTKEKLQNQNAIYTTALAMSMAGLPALVALFFTDAPAKIASGNVWFPFSCILLLSVFGTLVAWILFYLLVQRTDALFAASVTYLIPLIAVSWGILDGETLSLLQTAGMILILIGVYFTTKIVKQKISPA